MFTEFSFFNQCCTVSALCCVVDTAPDIGLSKERINRSIGNRVIKISLRSKGAERDISSRASHRSCPDRYASSFDIRADFLASCFILISCASAPSAPAWCSVSSSSLSSKSIFQVYRDQVPLHHYLSGVCCFQHHHHCCHHRHYFFHHR